MMMTKNQMMRMRLRSMIRKLKRKIQLILMLKSILMVTMTKKPNKEKMTKNKRK